MASFNLKEFISSTLTIPYIEPNHAVMDGSFTIEPYITSSLIGSGTVQNVALNSTVSLFYKSQTNAVSNGIALFKALNNESGVFCEDPDFTYENESNFWRTTLSVQEVLND